MSFLAEIEASTRARLRSLPGVRPPARVGSGTRPGERFVQALRGRDRIDVIAEVKRRSPSRGALAPAADALTQARRYVDCGAAAVSVLTEPTRFGGSFADLERVAAGVEAPVLMKDFVLSPEQVRVAAGLGASAFLLLLRLVDDVLAAELVAAGREYGIVALLEAHDERELARARSLPGILGINNRNLETLAIDRGLAAELAPLARGAPGAHGDRVVVAESGYTHPEHLRDVLGRVDAALIGSALMTTEDPQAFFRGVAELEQTP